MRWTPIAGLLAGATPPLAFGVFIIAREMSMRRLLPPDTPTCAMPMMAAWLFLLCVAPICGVAGMAVGHGCSAIYRALQPGPKGETL
jgi:hypothetical protein